MINALDHIQLPMPNGREDEARSFFGSLLGLEEIEKPAPLAGRGGAWFALPDGRQLHLGVEEPFRPNQKAHLAFVSPALDELARSLENGGYPVKLGWGTRSPAQVLLRGPVREPAGIPRSSPVGV